MRLIDLEPRFVTSHWDILKDITFGITFLCPCCKTERLGIMFINPIGDIEKIQQAEWADPRKEYKNLWNRMGDNPESLTLTPSIDASASGHWHGFITDGEIV